LHLSTFTHATACDPVVVQGNTAYVTLRTGSACSGTNNQLDVINIESPADPRLIKTYAMTNPHGLSVHGDRLYICEGDYGLKVLDVSSPDKVKELSFDKSIKSKDVIALSDQYIMVIGSDGFYFIDATAAKDLK